MLWSALVPGGVFISDDIQDNAAFSEFVKNHDLTFAVTEYERKFVGIARKAGAHSIAGEHGQECRPRTKRRPADRPTRLSVKLLARGPVGREFLTSSAVIVRDPVRASAKNRGKEGLRGLRSPA